MAGEGMLDLSMRHDTMKKHTPSQMLSLPYPFPPCAFGRSRPDDWLPSTTVRLESFNDRFSVSDGGEEETGAETCMLVLPRLLTSLPI